MISIVQASPADASLIVDIGKISVKQAHLGSCPETDLDQYLARNYNTKAISQELSDENNVYHILYDDGEPAGFSKIVLNASHPNIQRQDVKKLDSIYLLDSFFGKKLGYELMQFNIEFAKANNQSGIWLFTWVGNERAINFYQRCGFEIIGSHYFQVTETQSNLNHHMHLNLS